MEDVDSGMEELNDRELIRMSKEECRERIKDGGKLGKF